MHEQKYMLSEEVQFSRTSLFDYSCGVSPSACAVSYYLGNGIHIAVLAEADFRNMYAGLESTTMAGDIIQICKTHCAKLFDSKITPEYLATELNIMAKNRRAGYFRAGGCNPCNWSVIAFNRNTGAFFYCIGAGNLEIAGSHSLILTDRYTDKHKIFRNTDDDNCAEFKPFGYYKELPELSACNLLLVTGQLYDRLMFSTDGDDIISLYTAIISGDIHLVHWIGVKHNEIAFVGWEIEPFTTNCIP